MTAFLASCTSGYQEMVELWLQADASLAVTLKVWCGCSPLAPFQDE
jgi:hypothetical protein